MSTSFLTLEGSNMAAHISLKLRSLTSLLSIIGCNQVTPGGYHELPKKDIRILNSISILFVSRPTDAAAVYATITPHNIEMLQASDANTLVVDKNDESAEKRITSEDIDLNMPSSNWFLDYYAKSGVFDRDARCRHLVTLMENPQAASLREFASQLLLYCLPKINSCLGRSLFVGAGRRPLIFDPNLPEKISAAFSDDYDRSQSFSGVDETIICRVLKDRYQLESQLENGILVRSAEGEAALWRYFGDLVEILRSICKDVTDRVPKNAWEGIDDKLLYFSSSFILLHDLTKSPSFWRLLGNKGLNDHFTAPALINPDADHDTEADEDDDDNPAEWQGPPARRAILHWCKLQNRFISAAHMLHSGSLRKLFANRQVTITRVPTPMAPDPESQAALVDILEPLRDRVPLALREEGAMLKWLQGEAIDVPVAEGVAGDVAVEGGQIAKGVEAAQEAGKATQGAGKRAEVQQVKLAADSKRVKQNEIDKWKENFKGHMHCECILAATLRSERMEPPAIGVSKRCCFPCHFVLTALGIQHSATHGKVYPWAPPPDLDEKIQQDLYQILERHLASWFKTTFEESCSRRRDSESGKSEHDFTSRMPANALADAADFLNAPITRK